jgi:hypothetical protein
VGFRTFHFPGGGGERSLAPAVAAACGSGRWGGCDGGGGGACCCSWCGRGGGVAWGSLCSYGSAARWRLAGGSPMKEPSLRRSLRVLSSLCSWAFLELDPTFSFPFADGGEAAASDLPGTGVSRWGPPLGASGILIPRCASPLTYRTARPASSRVGSEAWTACRSFWSSHKGTIPLGSTSCAGS